MFHGRGDLSWRGKTCWSWSTRPLPQTPGPLSGSPSPGKSWHQPEGMQAKWKLHTVFGVEPLVHSQRLPGSCSGVKIPGNHDINMKGSKQNENNNIHCVIMQPKNVIMQYALLQCTSLPLSTFHATLYYHHAIQYCDHAIQTAIEGPKIAILQSVITSLGPTINCSHAICYFYHGTHFCHHSTQSGYHAIQFCFKNGNYTQPNIMQSAIAIMGPTIDIKQPNIGIKGSTMNYCYPSILYGYHGTRYCHHATQYKSNWSCIAIKASKIFSCYHVTR